jgi:hypothetical protein
MTCTRSYLAYAEDGEQRWSPIPELNRTDADVSLVVLAQNSVVYIEPVDDPFFAAHVDFNGLFQSRNATYYFADTYFHVLACAEQYQYCNNNSRNAEGQMKCTDLSSPAVIQKQASKINLSLTATMTTGLLDSLLPLANIFGSIGGSGAAALRASDIIFHQVSGPLPDNQWTIELSAWFNTALARIQHGVVEFATGPPDAFASTQELMSGKSVAWKELCSIIKVRDADNQQSFNALAVALLLGLGGIIILISWQIAWRGDLLDKLIRGEEANEWEEDDKLSLLQREPSKTSAVKPSSESGNSTPADMGGIQGEEVSQQNANHGGGPGTSPKLPSAGVEQVGDRPCTTPAPQTA